MAAPIKDLGLARPQRDFRHVIVEHLPFEDASFDIVFALHAIRHNSRAACPVNGGAEDGSGGVWRWRYYLVRSPNENSLGVFNSAVPNFGSS